VVLNLLEVCRMSCAKPLSIILKPVIKGQGQGHTGSCNLNMKIARKPTILWKDNNNWLTVSRSKGVSKHEVHCNLIQESPNSASLYAILLETREVSWSR